MEYMTQIVLAKKLMQDDRFRMAGQLYRISDVAFNDYGDRIIWAYPVDRQSHCLTLIVGRSARFKIYNLKP